MCLFAVPVEGVPPRVLLGIPFRSAYCLNVGIDRVVLDDCQCNRAWVWCSTLPSRGRHCDDRQSRPVPPVRRAFL